MSKIILIVFSFLLTMDSTIANAQKTTAKLIFSKTVNGTGETRFTSADYIYGRIEFTGGTVNDFFLWEPVSDKMPYFNLNTSLWIWYGNEYRQCHPYQTLMLKTDLRNKNVLHFDVLPEPSKASSVLLFSNTYRSSPSNSTFANSVSKDNFTKEGVYQIKYTVTGKTKDEWSKEKSIDIAGQFEFQFQSSDVAKILKERGEAEKKIKGSAFKLDKMPEIFSKNIQPTDPKLTRAKIAALLKRDMPGVTILKFAVGNHNSVWAIMKNEFGIPRFRYFVGNIHLIRKEGEICKADEVYLKEDYLGGGKYGSLKVAGGGGSESQLIECSVVK